MDDPVNSISVMGKGIVKEGSVAACLKGGHSLVRIS